MSCKGSENGYCSSSSGPLHFAPEIIVARRDGNLDGERSVNTHPNNGAGRFPSHNAAFHEEGCSNSVSSEGFTEDTLAKPEHFTEASCCNPRLTKPTSAASDTTSDNTITPASISRMEINDIDAEKGQPLPERVILSVQGMTCTGCEKSLYRALESLPQVSNIRTSVVLAQAEFDLNRSTSMDGATVISVIERRSGFTCTRIGLLGEVLDLIVDNVLDLPQNPDSLVGVTGLKILDKSTIRVTYDPRIVGARKLLSDPFFPTARLAPLVPRPVSAEGRLHVRSTFRTTLLSILLTVPVLVLAWAPLQHYKMSFETTSLILATIVQIAIAGPFYPRAINALFSLGVVEMDMLIVLSTTTAYTYSVVAYAYSATGKPLATGEFFDTSTLLVTIILIGRSVSSYARQKAVDSISMESLQTPTALLIDDVSSQLQEIDARLLQYQDNFKVLPETSIVTDGIVLAGESEVDEGFITGESTLITKRSGASVVAGSINRSGTLTVKVTRLPGENTIKAIETLVDEARLTKPKIQYIADRFAGFFVPVILVLALLVFVVWVAIGKLIRGQIWSVACINAMTYAISALVVSCPCAVGLAVPMVVLIAGGVGARHGLILKSSETIENARNIAHVIFDKTGTLTQGKLSVVAEEYSVVESESLAPIILGLTTNSKHPISCAITSHLKAVTDCTPQVQSFVSVAGNGIQATWKGRSIRAGNPHWLGFSDSAEVLRISSLGLTLCCVSVDDKLVAVFGLKDSLRSDAIQTIGRLKKRSIELSIVSGDSKEAVESVAKELHIPDSNVRSRCSPDVKQSYVKEMLARKNGVVVFCGDGTNDAAALAQASIGLHMNEGTEIAQNAADAILMRPSLSGILVLINLSEAFYRRVVFNFAWSVIYNIFAILLAAGAFPHARIPPQFAALGEVVSILPVIAVAMQLRWARLER